MNVFRRLFGWLLGRRLKPAPSLPASRPAAPGSPQSPMTVAPTPAEVVAKKGRSYGLDAGDYLPISREEIKEAARGRSLFANAWFGRRDRIPPADDPRTATIDRAMATQGFLSPEELAEIHAVGEEMERLRPTAEHVGHQAALAGVAAVEADRAERARIKAQRKAEAAERKRLRAEAIALRRREDIVFLGRKVSARLGERASRVDDLQRAGLPVLSTPAELALAMRVSIPRLRWLAFHAEVATRVHYVQFRVPKKSGGERVLSAPRSSLRRVQRWILDQVLKNIPAGPHAHGFVAGRSILTNATPHAGKAVVVNLDLEDFFPSIGFPRVRKVFEQAGYSGAVSTILALLCTECPRKTVTYQGETLHVATGPRGLPQGACTSPVLSNHVAIRLDRRLAGVATKLGFAYTRYADDLTFSGPSEVDAKVGYLLAKVRHIAQEEGFAINAKKTRVLRRNARQEVTGLVVNDRPGVRRDEIRRLRAILHRARTEGLASQNREGRPDFRAWLLGKIAFVRMARPEVGERLLAEFHEIDRGRSA
ncbi:Reverse transcriptase (RNA-dependent DNA polymerase) [Aquisphaera giovannonii]|uniref:RNA-directed DNA polymerase n=1 Tax=Aquisphaera giovannonii TaxID=406548 RepID=A0A5B9WB11_9BACT|nr:reverse transcriptase family protein [Aquisphaera giovannonii]QEH37070.1 Reverse transcriptase (RNA-dependent DNA polymerase) [Aquisphaera giovannonii]